MVSDSILTWGSCPIHLHLHHQQHQYAVPSLPGHAYMIICELDTTHMQWNHLQTDAPRHTFRDGATNALCQRPILHRGNTMRDAHLSIWAASAGAGLIWRDSGLHGLCQLSCLQIHLTPLPAPSTRLSQTCCQEVYHKELYICYLQQLPQLRPRALLCQACVSSSTKQDSGVVFRGVPYTALQASATAHAKNQGTCSNILGAVMLSIRRGRTGGPHRVDSARWR